MRKRIKLGDLVTDNIRYLRNKRGWTQHELEIQANLSFNYINFIESYRFYPSYKNVEKIAKALQIEPYKLFTEVENER